MSRKLLIVANWKMHPTPSAASQKPAPTPYHSRGDIDVVVFPTFLDIRDLVKTGVIVGGQYGRSEAEGAHTGDISMHMLAEAGCRYVLCGHSERRNEHKETDEDIAAQVIAALETKLHPILCVGESAKERKQGKEQEVIERQLKSIPLESDITIAYEPIWAIGTGETSSPEQAQNMHSFIRSLLPEDRREITRIIYGGSMNPENAKGLLEQPDIDGGLIGNASLDPTVFGEIVEIAASL